MAYQPVSDPRRLCPEPKRSCPTPGTVGPGPSYLTTCPECGKRVSVTKRGLFHWHYRPAK